MTTPSTPEAITRRGVVLERLRALAVPLLALVLLVQCDDDDGCEPGETCVCRGGHDCYLDCDGDSCNHECSALDRCGSVCGDHCLFTCFSTQECSAACGADCFAECHDTSACGMICGPDCSYDCHNADRCGARVGPNSEVRCTDVGSCVVECEGSCRVLCTRVGGPGCDVRCLRGPGPAPCPGDAPDCVACAG